ncbi:MAG TPA: ectonucleotide pyrophosphatase/phosphodiesterase [Bryobacteraceae bacterium]|nr:ectonucleotide pyrophosphatase/phosphodiesterase [Bryobacteraceae bacterium]
MTRRYSFRLLAAIAALPIALCAQPAPQRPYVVLVSLDGFRYDYAAKYQATHLLEIAKAGAAAEAMIPSFPTITFPNHISIVTGQYPGHHGLVSNAFYDPLLKQMYSMRNSADESEFYHYQPLWVLAEQQHVKAAAMFWPTADAEIEGVRPSYWEKFDDSFPGQKRVEKVLGWLQLPEAERPHFITLYFSDVDSAGHRFGPDAAETAQAVERVDKWVGDLWTGIQRTNLPVNLIVVSDHGMQKIEGAVNLSDYADMSKVRVVNEGPMLLLYSPNAETTEKMYGKLKGHSPIFDVYRRQETPERWHYRDSDRIGDLVVYVHGAKVAVTGMQNRTPHGGAHGFDEQELKTMDAIFYAAGPNVKPGMALKPFENVNVFPFITRILGLKNPPDLDGKEAVLDTAYRN